MKWYDITAAEAVNIELPHPGIEGPLTSDGEPCPWPWEPLQLKGVPMGQYHCGYCGEMCIAGMEHVDYSEDPYVKAQLVAKVDRSAGKGSDPPGEDGSGRHTADAQGRCDAGRPGDHSP